MTIDGIDDAWDRVCETARRLGFTELHLTPRPDFLDLCPERHSFMPRPDLRPAARHGELEPVTDATWSIEVMTLGAIVAEVVARRPLQPFDFDPRRFAAVVQKHVASEVRAAEAEAEAAVGAA